MGIEGDIVEEVVVGEGEGNGTGSKEYSPTNPVTGEGLDKPEAKPAEEKQEAKPEPKQEEKKEEEPALPKGVQKRIDRAVREKYEAQARAKMLEERLTAIEQRQTQQISQKPIDKSEPRIENFNDFDEYVAAKAEWIASKKINETLAEREQRTAAERVAAAQGRAVENWNKRLAETTAELPDFEEVVGGSDLPMTELMRDAIIESEMGPKIAYWLANNPQEAQKIAGMSPFQTVAAIGRIEERLESQAKAPKKTTSAPPPVKPVGSKASATKDPGQMTDAEYAEWRKKGRA